MAANIVYQNHTNTSEDNHSFNDLSPFIKQLQTLKERNSHKKYKLVIAIRHSEGVHNYTKHKVVGPKQWKAGESKKMKYVDAPLTEEGVKQCQNVILPKIGTISKHVDFIVISPLQRTIQTCIYGIMPHFVDRAKYPKYYSSPGAEEEKTEDSTDDSTENGNSKSLPPLVVLEYCRERMNVHTCDHRRPLSVTSKEFSEFDFTYEGFVDDKDTLWNPKESEPWEDLKKRMLRFLNYLWDRDESVIVYSGHCDAIMAILQIVEGCQSFKPPNAACIPLLLERKA